MRAVYPGSFDPLTLGHLDLIERGAVLFEGLVVAVLQNPSKTPTFSLEQHLDRVDVRSFDGLTVNVARESGAGVILRGLRAMSDFEFELQLAHTNKSLAPQLETMFLATAVHHSFLSSSVVKEVARFGGDVSRMVPKGVAEDLKTLFNRSSPSR
jgi:pantetheine-phosphate adenylyltransferase